MKENLKDILTNLSVDIDQETLLLYLQGKLSAEKQHELEKQVLNNDFEADALEGLQTIKDEKHLNSIVIKLNRDLKKKTKSARNFRYIKPLQNEPWLYITLAILLMLIVICYFIIHIHLYHS